MIGSGGGHPQGLFPNMDRGRKKRGVCRTVCALAMLSGYYGLTWASNVLCGRYLGVIESF